MVMLRKLRSVKNKIQIVAIAKWEMKLGGEIYGRAYP